jgi:tungstate transport system permease protein
MERFDAEIWQIVLLSLEVSGVAVAFSTLIGVPLGTWLGQARFRGKRVVTVLTHTGLAMPPVVVGLVLYLLLSRSGPLGSLGWLFTPRAMILAQIILTLPFILGITQAAVEAVPPELPFQLRALGASARQARWAVLREAWPGVLLAVATAFGRSLSEVGAVLLVGGNIQGQTRVLTTAIILETNKGDFAMALLLGAILLTLALMINIAIMRLHGRPVP